MKGKFDNTFKITNVGLTDISINSLTKTTLNLTEDEALNLATWIIMMLGYYRFKEYHKEWLHWVMGQE